MYCLFFKMLSINENDNEFLLNQIRIFALYITKVQSSFFDWALKRIKNYRQWWYSNLGPPGMYIVKKKFCRPQVAFFPIIKVIPQFFIRGISSNTPLIQRMYKI